MLGQDLERAIDEAWVRVRREILSDRDELHRRLARRRMKSLTRPPRAWCVAIRASDRRITPAHWIITPEHALDLNHPEHPYEPIEHEVTIQTHAIRRYCHPIRIARPGEDVVDVAQRLGAHPQTLRNARSAGVFDERSYKGLGGKRGHPVPVIYTEKLLDPSFLRYRAAPHPLWGASWEFLAQMIPQDFEQTVVRRPLFGRFSALNDGQLREWRWVCPGCKKEVRTIYYPLPVRTMFDRWFIEPVIQLKLSDADLPGAPPATFACHKCHGVTYFSTMERNCWNHLIAYLTGGLLYGCEVQKPKGFVPERKRMRVRPLNRSAPMQRKVLARLANGWSYFRIAVSLGITVSTARHHVYNICAQEDVADRHALAEKLKFAVSPPLHYLERAGLRRVRVKELMMQGLSNKQIMEELDLDHRTVIRDVGAIYEIHGVSGLKKKCRRALAKKLGVVLPPGRVEQLRERISSMLDAGMTGPQMAMELKMALQAVEYHATQLRREKRKEAGDAAKVEVAVTK